MITTFFRCLGCFLLNANISSSIEVATKSFEKPRFPVPIAGKDMEVRPVLSAFSKQSLKIPVKVCWANNEAA